MEELKIILIIHPEKQLQDACKRILFRNGYDIKCCNESSQASQFVYKYIPRTVITAVRMPEKDGFQVLRTALAKRPGLPAIAITTHASVPEAVTWLKAGGADYLAIPFGADQLVRSVEDSLLGFQTDSGPHLHELTTGTAMDAIIGISRP